MLKEKTKKKVDELYKCLDIFDYAICKTLNQAKGSYILMIVNIIKLIGIRYLVTAWWTSWIWWRWKWR